MLGYYDEVGLVSEASTYKELVEFIWDELSTTPTLFSSVVSPGRMYGNISIY